MAQQRVAVIHDGVVSNTIIADPTTYKDATGGSVVASDTAEIGWTYDGANFVAPPPPAASPADLLAYASQRQNVILAQVWSFSVAAATQGGPSLTLTTRLDAGGSGSMMKLMLWSMTAGAGATEAYSNVDFSPATLNPTQANSLATQAGAVESQTYAVLNQLAAGINASPPTITTEAQIDSASWPMPATNT